MVTRNTCDILRYERRKDDFALVRIEADGSRHELILTAANIIHLGMLAPDFARRLFAHKIGEKSRTVGTSLRTKLVSNNIRAIEMLVRILERTGSTANVGLTEKKARQLASKLLARADQLAKTAGGGASNAAAHSADDQP